MNREKELDTLAYKIAKQISEVARTEDEVENMIVRIKYQFSNYRKKVGVKLGDYPTNIVGEEYKDSQGVPPGNKN